MKFSQVNINKLTAPQGGDTTVWDDGLPGFGVRFRNGGAGIYIIRYRLDGKQNRLPLGAVAKVTLAAAQIEARQHFAKIAKGENPALERAQKASKANSATTIGQLVPLFLTHQEARGRVGSYVAEIRRSMERYFAALHRYAPDDVTRKMVAAELDKIEADRGPIAMTRSRAHLSKFWSWAIAKGYVDGGNPVSGTEKVAPKARDRQHTEKELAVIWRMSNDANDYDVIQKLIMLTGARRDQIGQLKRNEVKRADRVVKFSGPGRSKNGTTFMLPLSVQALALINMVWDRRKDDSGYLFGEGDGGFSGWSKSSERFAERLGDQVDSYWLHDFRRTFQNIGQTKLKIPLHITDACMNHIGGEAKQGVRRHYNFAEYDDEKREAMEKWGAYIDSVVHPRNLRRVV